MIICDRCLHFKKEYIKANPVDLPITPNHTHSCGDLCEDCEGILMSKIIETINIFDSYRHEITN